MPAWDKRCILPLQVQAAEREESLTPARSPTAVERTSTHAKLSADSGNLLEAEGAGALVNADEAAHTSFPRAFTAAPQKPDPASATNAQQSKPEPGTQKRNNDAMETEPPSSEVQMELMEAQLAFPAIADKINTLIQLYPLAENATDTTANNWAKMIKAPAADVRGWLVWKQARHGIVRQSAAKRRKVSHHRQSSEASSVKQESPVVANRVVHAAPSGSGANHVSAVRGILGSPNIRFSRHGRYPVQRTNRTLPDYVATATAPTDDEPERHAYVRGRLYCSPFFDGINFLNGSK
ncbi:hypothetical protein AURDEDRAFT_170641 [Auricularia subglabra TFB-10046 SS5]|nr:hypothetical protein AURDEDRAFT_170641 [Auricularia subglabra TFB-10046 SS5]